MRAYFRVLAVVLSFFFALRPAFAAPTKVACVGASTTAGSGSTTGHHYPDELQRILGDTYEVKNFGLSGTTMLKTGDKPYWDSAEHKAALAYQPDIAIFWFGGNDSKVQNWDQHHDEFLPDYEEMVRQFQSLPSHARTFVVLSMLTKDVSGIRKDVVDNEVVPLVRMVAADTGSGVVDLNGRLAGRDDLVVDGVHPNDKGTIEIAKLVAEQILAAPDAGSAVDAATGGDDSGAGSPSTDGGAVGAAGAAGSGGASMVGAGGGTGGRAATGGSSGSTTESQPSGGGEAGESSGCSLAPGTARRPLWGLALAGVGYALRRRSRARRACHRRR
jgi:acyl-CoA thioesterase I